MTTTRATASILLLLLGLQALACSSVRTRIDYDPATDFATWQTWAWYEGADAGTGDPRLDDPLIHRRVVAAIERELTERGYAQAADDASPDFYVKHHLALDSRIDVRTVNRSYHRAPVGRSWGASGWTGTGWTETRVREIDEGTIMVDLLDASASRLAWRGAGTRRVSRDLQGDQLTRRIDEVVNEILRRFPPSS